ncbi:MAG: AMP-binding protein [Candidatus Omnitrophica bacterium]|nr:AMP-binding protein [Candidatus Omnitrophota bacterium]MCF7894015.1 AMP-binding protein [Candidatus Omnitrophota bacterium]
MQIAKLLAQKSKKYPKKAAFICKDLPVSFAQLKDKSFSIANYLLELGPIKSKKVAVYLPNLPDTVFSIFGVLSAGGVLVPLDYMLTEIEIINFINHSQAQVLIIQPKKEVSLDWVKQQCPGLKKIVISGSESKEFTSISDIFTKSFLDFPQSSVKDQDDAAIFYTSGSTGHPKGVALTYQHLINPIEVIDNYLTVSCKDVFLCGGIPFSHIGGLDFILFMLYFGFTLILMERFQPLDFLRNIQKHKVTLFCVVPAMFMAILFLKGAKKFDLSFLKYAVVFGAPSSPAVLKRFHKLCPNAQLRNGWGMTETSAPNSYSPADQNKLSSIGRFDFNLEAKIVDNQGSQVPQGNKGELWVRGKGVMKGYYREPKLTKQVLTEDRWLKTGDIAKKDKEGFFYIVGRKKEMIKVAGEIVFSPEVENVIQKFPGVVEVAVVGKKDKLRGEVPKAFLVVDKSDQFDNQKFRDFLKQHLAHFKIPQSFEFCEKLPKNRTGKIDKLKLTKTIKIS